MIAIENVRLVPRTRERNAELREALEHQTATSNILQVIASSPTDIQPVLDAVAENAGRLCDANGHSNNARRGRCLEAGSPLRATARRTAWGRDADQPWVALWPGRG